MVVGKEEAMRVGQYGKLEHFPGMHEAGRERAHRNDVRPDGSVARIERNDDARLAVEVMKQGVEHGADGLLRFVGLGNGGIGKLAFAH